MSFLLSLIDITEYFIQMLFWHLYHFILRDNIFDKQEEMDTYFTKQIANGYRKLPSHMQPRASLTNWG